MELEHFKDLWPKDTVKGQKQDEYLLSLIGKRSNSPIAKMKRNLRWELIAVIVLYSIGIVYYFFAFGGKMIEISWFMIVLGLLFVAYYLRKNKLLNEMQCVTCQVKSHLEKQLGTLEKYIRFYLIAGNLMFPVTMLIVGYIAIVIYPAKLNDSRSIWNSEALQQLAVKYLLITIVISFVLYFVNRWYVNRLYGRHVRKLREMLNDMEEQANT
ncbi:MAG TPA: hypothetical protein VGD17_03650 [Chitinophagaceae bacterium]